MQYILNVLIAIDQLGNTIGGGSPSNTVSARVGYFAVHAGMGKICWQFLEKVIDFAFYPLDGPGHCRNSYMKDMDEGFIEGRTVPYIFLGLLILLITPFIGVVLHTVVFIFPSIGWEAKHKKNVD